jgi:hypothetical protein
MTFQPILSQIVIAWSTFIPNPFFMSMFNATRPLISASPSRISQDPAEFVQDQGLAMDSSFVGDVARMSWHVGFSRGVLVDL